MKTLLATLLTLGCVGSALAQIHTETVEYKDTGDTVLQGYAAYDEAIPGKRPGDG